MTGTSQRVAITGANGYVGSLVAEALRSAGHEVVELVRRPSGGGDRRYDLEAQLPAELLRDIDVVVHAAWQLGMVRGEQETVNIRGTLALVEAASASGVRMVFISSMSAYPETKQKYGMAKLECESAVTAAGGLSLRLGLVWGAQPRGMAGSLQRLSGLHVVPIPGRDPYQFTLHEPDLAVAVATAVSDQEMRGVVGTASPRRVPLRAIIDTLGSGGHRRWMFSVPWLPLWLALRMCEQLQLHLPFRSDSLLGLVRPAATVTSVNEWSRRGVFFAPLGG